MYIYIYIKQSKSTCKLVSCLCMNKQNDSKRK